MQKALAPAPHIIWPVGQTQLPPTQTSLDVHALPQPPQFAWSVAGFTHVIDVPHVMPPVMFAHITQRLPTQLSLVGQTLPQPPQLLWSLVLSTQSALAPVPHKLSVPGHTQAVAPHVEPVGQVLPQVTQLSVVVRLTHAWPASPVHKCSVPGQMHWPAEHVPPVGHALLQPPQFFGSICSLTQAPLQVVAHASATAFASASRPLSRMPVSASPLLASWTSGAASFASRVASTSRPASSASAWTSVVWATWSSGASGTVESSNLESLPPSSLSVKSLNPRTLAQPEAHTSSAAPSHAYRVFFTMICPKKGPRRRSSWRPPRSPCSRSSGR